MPRPPATAATPISSSPITARAHRSPTGSLPEPPGRAAPGGCGPSTRRWHRFRVLGGDRRSTSGDGHWTRSEAPGRARSRRERPLQAAHGSRPMTARMWPPSRAPTASSALHRPVDRGPPATPSSSTRGRCSESCARTGTAVEINCDLTAAIPARAPPDGDRGWVPLCDRQRAHRRGSSRAGHGCEQAGRGWRARGRVVNTGTERLLAGRANAGPPEPPRRPRKAPIA